MAFPNKITPNGDLIFGGELPNFMAPPNPVFETNATTRYAVEADLTLLVVHMCKSSDKGVTWADVDQANAPAIPADGSGGGGFTEVYEFISAVMDPASKIIYAVLFDPLSFNVMLAPFDANPASGTFDTWLAPIISTLSYLPDAASSFFNSGSFACVFRPVDRAVWVWWYAGGADPTDVATTWGAKCLVTAAGTGTWDLALTRMAGMLQDGIEYAQGGAGVDNGGNIHYWISRHYYGFGATGHTTQHSDGLGNKIIDSLVLDAGGAGFLAGLIPMQVHVTGVGFFNGTGVVLVDGGPVVSFNDPPGLIGTAYVDVAPDPVVTVGTSPANSDLLHYVMHPDDAIVGPQFIAHDGLQIINTSAINCTPGNVLLSSYQAGSNVGASRHILRAVAGDAPAWEDTTPAAIQEPGFATLIDMVHRAVDGLDYVVFAIRVAGLSNYSYATSPGIGQPFDVPVLIGIEPGGPDAASGVLVAGIYDDLGLTFPFGDGAGFPAIGMGFFEAPLPVCEVGIMSGLGVKIKDWSGKYYMNDYVPAELIFGFDNSQGPGFPYPEIYIPKDQALYLDLAPFLNSPVNGLLTLCFKGMKVYGEQ